MGFHLPPGVETKCLELASPQQRRPSDVLLEPPPRNIPEKAFMWKVIGLAVLCGWAYYHTHDSRRSTPGFPDLVLVRDSVLWVELKTTRGSLTIEQCDWIAKLKNAQQAVRVWRPGNWLEIVEALR